MDLYTRGVTPQGLFENAFVDPYDRFLDDNLTKFQPAALKRSLLMERDKIVDNGYKWIFEYRGLQQSRYQTLLQKLNGSFNATLDRAFAANGGARAGAVPILRNYWDIWNPDQFISGTSPNDDTNGGTPVGYYPDPEPPANVKGGGNIKALDKIEISFTPFTNIPTTLNPMGVAAMNYGDSNLWTNAVAEGGTTPRPAIGENPFLKSFFQELIRVEIQEMFSQFIHLPGELYIAGNASDTFGSALSATVLIDYNPRTQRMKMTLNKATAFYHS